MNEFFDSSLIFHNAPKAIYFINVYDVIMYKMDSLGDIKKQLFERIDFQKRCLQWICTIYMFIPKDILIFTLSRFND